MIDGSRVRSVGIIGFDRVEALDLLGPYETFCAARIEGRSAYRVDLLGATSLSFRSESGVAFAAVATLAEALAYDLIVVPGGSGLRAPDTLSVVAAWLRGRVTRTGRIASVCTGLYALAEAGLLDNRRATTHWRFAADVAKRYPLVRLEPGEAMVRDGTIFTSAGVTTGIDLALALISEDHGAAAALEVAREFVTPVRGRAGQAEFVDGARFAAQAGQRLAELCD